MKTSRIKRTNYKKNIEINKKKGYLAIIGCLMVDIAVGEFNLLSYLYPYIASYFHLKNSKIDQDDMNFIPIVWLLTMSISNPLGIAMFKKLGYKGSFITFLLIFGISQFCVSYIEDYWIFIWIYAIFGGIAQGGCTILPLYCGWRYFPAEYKTRISGILLSAYALAPIPSSFLALYIINPKNIDANDDGYFPAEVAEKLPDFYRYFGLGMMIFGLIGVFLITEPLPINQKEEEELKMKQLKKGKKKKRVIRKQREEKKKIREEKKNKNDLSMSNEEKRKTIEVEKGVFMEMDQSNVTGEEGNTKEKIITKAKEVKEIVKEKLAETIDNIKRKSEIFKDGEQNPDDYRKITEKKKKAKFGIARFTETDQNSQSSKIKTFEDSRGSSSAMRDSQKTQQSGEESGKLAEGVEMIRTNIQPFKISDLNIFKDRIFLNCYLILLIEYIFPHFGLFSFKKIALENDRKDRFITFTGIIGSLFNAGSRLIIALCFEKFGYAISAYAIMFIEVTSSLIFYPAAKKDWSFMISICWFYNTYGAQLGLYPLVTDTLFKSKGAFSYSILFSAFSFSSVIILFSMEFIQKWVGGYENLMYVLSVVAILPIYNIWILDKKIKEVSGRNKETKQRLREIEEVATAMEKGAEDEEEEEGKRQKNTQEVPFAFEDEEALV